jgi:hypothetical protein
VDPHAPTPTARKPPKIRALPKPKRAAKRKTSSPRPVNLIVPVLKRSAPPRSRSRSPSTSSPREASAPVPAPVAAEPDEEVDEEAKTARREAAPAPEQKDAPPSAESVEPAEEQQERRPEVEVTVEPEQPADDRGAQIFGSDDEGDEPRDTRSEGAPSRHASESPPRRHRRSARRTREEVDDEYEDEPLDVDSDYEDEDEDPEEPPTEEELQDEYRALLKRLRRMYPYLEIEMPPAGTSSKRLRKIYRYYVDEVSTAEGLEKYKIGLIVAFAILEVVGKKIGLPCDGYAELQQDQLANYHSMLVEFGDRDYFGFARSWPVEARLLGMMLLNMAFLVMGRMLLEPDTMKKLISAVTGTRGTPAIQLDNPQAQSPDAAATGAAPAAGAASSASAGGGAGALGSLLTTLMGALAGGGGPPARERSDQAGPTYRRRRARA